MRKPSAKSIPMSGNGRPPSSVNWDGAGGVAPGRRGPSYQRGRSSRAHWRRSSWKKEAENWERRLAFSEWERFCSSPFMEAPQESTSKVPFSCSALVKPYFSEAW